MGAELVGCPVIDQGSQPPLASLSVIDGNPFIAYAQNQEDVVLSRLLALEPHGRFIDVGAGHPQLENVTYSLYQRGWRGINVEPMAREAALLREMRPEDETVQAAVGAAPGTITLYEAPLENRGATTSALRFVQRHTAAGATFRPFESPVVTLSSLLGKFEPGSVHVVKIDVEGMETDVLQGAALELHQPWVLVIEATEPNSTVTAHEKWEYIVLEAGYQHTLFDGLNRFYVRQDLKAVRELLSVPANVLDKCVPAAVAQLAEQERYIQSLLQRATSAENYAKSLETARARATTELNG